jgi:hypothetical protein
LKALSHALKAKFMSERGFFESRQQGDARKVVVNVITKVRCIAL